MELIFKCEQVPEDSGTCSHWGMDMASPPRHPLPASGDLKTISFRKDSRIVREAFRLSAFLRRSGRAAALHPARCLRSHGATRCLRHGLARYISGILAETGFSFVRRINGPKENVRRRKNRKTVV